MYIKPDETEKIKQIFKRLNKSSYNLNKIEIRSSQMVEYDFMILCKILCGLIKYEDIDDYIVEIKLLSQEAEEDKEDNEIEIDDNEYNEYLSENVKSITPSGMIENILEILSKDDYVFTSYQIRRQVNLQYIINILGTIIYNEFIHRNLSERKIIEISELISNDVSSFSNYIVNFNITCGILIDFYKSTTTDEF